MKKKLLLLGLALVMVAGFLVGCGGSSGSGGSGSRGREHGHLRNQYRVNFELCAGPDRFLVKPSTSSNREKEARLSVTSRQIAAQMEDRLRKMDVVMNYLISEPDFLRDITLLGIADAREDVSGYLYEATTEVNVTLTTDYIVRNTHRAVFFNQTGYLFSSYIRNSSGAPDRRIAQDFSPDALPYLSQADAARGKSVFVGPHADPLRLSGRRGGVFVDKGPARLSDGVSGSGERHFRFGFPAKS